MAPAACDWVTDPSKLDLKTNKTKKNYKRMLSSQPHMESLALVALLGQAGVLEKTVAPRDVDGQ